MYHERQPRIVELRQRVPAFEFPLEEWGNYPHFIAIDPGKCSHYLLRTGIFPDLRFVTAMQRLFQDRIEGITNSQWPIWVEAYKYHLRDLGMIERRGRRSSAFGGSGLEHHVFLPEAWNQLAGLRLTMFVPEGEYKAEPNLENKKRGELHFNRFVKVDETKRGLWVMASKPDDEDYLRAIDIRFDYEHTAAEPQTTEVNLAEIHSLNLEGFIEEVRNNVKVILALVEEKRHDYPHTVEKSALSLYLPALLKSKILHEDPFVVEKTQLPADRNPEIQEEINIMAVAGATKGVAYFWLRDHPESELARTILQSTIQAPRIVQLAFLKEVWPMIAKELIS